MASREKKWEGFGMYSIKSRKRGLDYKGTVRTEEEEGLSPGASQRGQKKKKKRRTHQGD